jgi:hypothetical protein
MPSESKAEQRLMGAAEHGADFPAAKKLRASMTHEQLHDFASGSMKGKPEHVQAGGGTHPHRLAGSHDGMTISEHHRPRIRRR